MTQNNLSRAISCALTSKPALTNHQLIRAIKGISILNKEGLVG
jgi:hypothetical protein